MAFEVKMESLNNAAIFECIFNMVGVSTKLTVKMMRVGRIVDKCCQPQIFQLRRLEPNILRIIDYKFGENNDGCS